MFIKVLLTTFVTVSKKKDFLSTFKQRKLLHKIIGHKHKIIFFINSISNILI